MFVKNVTGAGWLGEKVYRLLQNMREVTIAELLQRNALPYD